TLASGVAAVVPGDPDASELAFRVTTDEPTLRMPPPSTGKSLSPAQVEILTAWVAQGAAWEGHWSLETPERPPLPRVLNADWVRNPIDAFILARLEAEGIAPAPEAD